MGGGVGVIGGMAAAVLALAAGCGVRWPDSGSGGADMVTANAGNGDCVVHLDCMPPAPDTGDYAADCVARVNQFRSCLCLPVLARWTDGEPCAGEEAAYDTAHGVHAGFIAGICTPEGLAEDECPAWGSEASTVSSCLQEMFDEGAPPAGACAGDCLEAHGHFINMSNPAYTMVACGIAADGGAVTALQNFQ